MFIVGTGDLATILGVTSRWIQKLTKDEILIQCARGKYDLPENIQRYIQYNQHIHEVNGQEVDYNKEKALHERAKRKRAEIELARIEGRMHAAEDIEKGMTDMLAAFRNRLLALPTKAAPRVVGKADIPMVEEVLRKEVYEALNELKDYDPAMFQREIGHDHPDDADDDQQSKKAKGGIKSGRSRR